MLAVAAILLLLLAAFFLRPSSSPPSEGKTAGSPSSPAPPLDFTSEAKDADGPEVSQEEMSEAPDTPDVGTLSFTVMTPEGPAGGAEIILYEQFNPEWQEGGGWWDEEGSDEEKEDSAEEEDEPPRLLTGTADFEGRVELTEVPAHVPLFIEVRYPETTGGWETERALEVGEYRERDPIEIRWTGEISVEVRDVNGRPVSGANLDLNYVGWRSTSRNLFADDSGEYRFTGLRAGLQVQVAAWSDEYLYGRSEPIAVKPREQLAVSVILERGQGFAAGVEFVDGEPVEGAEIQLATIGTRRFQSLKATTDRSGRYRIAGISPGPLRWSLSYGDYRHQVEVDAVADLPSLVRIPRWGVVLVRVVDEFGRPLPGAKVSAYSARSRGSLSGETDKTGVARFEQVQFGDGRVSARSLDYEGARADIKIPQTGVVDVKLSLAPMPDIRFVPFHIQAIDTSGRPIEGVEVKLAYVIDRGTDSDDGLSTGVTGPDGRVILEYPESHSFVSFRFKKAGWLVHLDVEPPEDHRGTYVHTMVRPAQIDAEVFVGDSRARDVSYSIDYGEDAWDDESRVFWASFPSSLESDLVRRGQVDRLRPLPPERVRVMAHIESGADIVRMVDLEEGAQVTETFRFPEPFEVEVLVFINGRPADGGKVSLDLDDDEEIGQQVWGKDVTAGSVIASLNFRGSYDVRYRHDGLELSMGTEAWIDGPRQIRLDLTASSLRGRFESPTGDPISQARIRMFGKKKHYDEVLDAEGRFEIPALDPGVYSWALEFAPPHLVPYGVLTVQPGHRAQTISLEEGRPVQITRAMKPGHAWGIYRQLEGRWIRCAWSYHNSLRVVLPPGDHALRAHCYAEKRRLNFEVTADQSEMQVELLPDSE